MMRITDEPNKVEYPRALKTLRVAYEGGSLDGKTANFPTRDFSGFVVGVHPGRNQHFVETYKRTTCIDIGSQRTIFRCAGLSFQANNSSWWKELLAVLHIRKLKAIVI